jgi:hypothetical protein
MQAVLNIGTTYRRRSLRPQGQAVVPSIGEGVHFLVDNVGGIAHTTRKKKGVLKSGRINPLITVKLADSDRFLIDKAPVGLLCRQNIRSTPWCPKQINLPAGPF